MAMSTFYDVPIGATQEQVVSSLGKPYSTRELSDGSVEYVYIEKIKEGDRNLQVRRYLILMRDGKVVSKQVKQSSPPPYLFDSYEMQTTQGEDPRPDEP
jgi:outer membrane protein assembly factor BamE (lipoprotein component of BamABCDE complex)